MLTRTKYIGIALTLIGIAVLYLGLSRLGAELPLMTGLFLLMFSKEKIEDERAKALRSKSLMLSFATVYIFEVVTTYLFNEQVIGFHLSQPRYLMILVLGLSTILFYVQLLATGKQHEEFN